MQTVQEYLAAAPPHTIRRGRIACTDGFGVSIQASHVHYCEPRSETGPWSQVELGYPSADPGEVIRAYAENPYQPTDTVYPYVPIELVEALIAQHGGIVQAEKV